MRPEIRLILRVLSVTAIITGCGGAQAPPAPPPPEQRTMKLWSTFRGVAEPQMRIAPGDPGEAETYYKEIYPKLKEFPKATIIDSSIEDMLAYYGFRAIPPATLEAQAPDVIMDFEKLRTAVAAPEFDAAYQANPLRLNEIAVVRFFAPKIVNVRDTQTAGVPFGGFGWRKVLRFRARDGSPARNAGLDAFYLLFNFASKQPAFPEGIHAAQIQAMLVPTYPTSAHLDSYFLVYDGLGTPTAGKVGLFLTATFDLEGSVPQDKYFVPRACGQCHGTEAADQKRAKVNYLDTDHWIDRTQDDFTSIPAAKVLVDGDASVRHLSAAERRNCQAEQRRAGSVRRRAVRGARR